MVKGSAVTFQGASKLRGVVQNVPLSVSIEEIRHQVREAKIWKASRLN